jgi:hypothetical protein
MHLVYDHVVKSPPLVYLATLVNVGPNGELLFLRVEMPKDIYKALIQEILKAGSFKLSEARLPLKRYRIVDVYGIMRNIQIPSENDRLFVLVPHLASEILQMDIPFVDTQVKSLFALS